MSVTPMPIMANPIPSETEKAAALAANLRERARTVEQVGEPVIQSFTNPSFRQLQDIEREQADSLAEFAATDIFGVTSRDRLPKVMAANLECAAMSLVRRIHPQWVKAAYEQAVETLLVTDEFVVLTKDRSAAERRLLAHRHVTAVWCAFLGVLEARISVRPETYLRVAAARAEAGAL